jgi:poly-gamma-glutamate synthesis protein (capsule biosynthesis protein)
MKVFLSFLMSLMGAGQASLLQMLPYGEELKQVIFPPAEVRMLSFGDLMLDRDVKKFMEQEGADYPFEKIFGPDGIDRTEYDYMTANLEGPIVDAPKRADLFPQFAFDPELAPGVLQKYGFDLLSTANNHSWDHNAKGWESTLESLNEVGIAHVGHPKNHFEFDQYETEINGLSFGFMGITDMLFDVDWEEAKSTATELKQRNDFVILMIHWGVEYKMISSFRQQDKAHGMMDAGVDMIIGHHPHVVQEHEYYKGKPIYYSLGNFVFDQYFSQAVQNGLGLDITFREDGEIFIEEIPFQINKGQPFLAEADE